MSDRTTAPVDVEAALSTPVRTELAELPRPLVQDTHGDSFVDERGELRASEFSWRFGLLLGAGLFFHESLHWPWERNLPGLAGILLAALVVLTMALQWRTLGDYRRRSQQLILVLAMGVLSFPIAAALSPNVVEGLGGMGFDSAVLGLTGLMGTVPGVAIMLELFRGVVSSLFFAVALLILLFGSARRRGGVYLLAAVLAGSCLFFHPKPEVMVGFVFLGLFFASQWETALMVSDKLRPHLKPVQLDFLRELLEQGALTTGETKLYLDNNPESFRELVEYRLAEFDNVAREVVPGPRLLHDPASAALEGMVSALRRVIWILIGIVYVIMPDFFPGPIDDIIVMFLCTGVGLGWLKELVAPGRLRDSR